MNTSNMEVETEYKEMIRMHKHKSELLVSEVHGREGGREGGRDMNSRNVLQQIPLQKTPCKSYHRFQLLSSRRSVACAAHGRSV